MYRQSKWDEPLIFDLPQKGERETFLIDDTFLKYFNEFKESIPNELLRTQEPNIPNLSEIDVVRHYTRLTQMSYGIDLGPVPLGSCTMKYNPRICEDLASREEVTMIHPYQDEEEVQGILEIMYIVQKWLAEITGMDVCCLQPPAGASGEFVGALIIKKYHRDLGKYDKDEMIIPDNAHGSNPASAAMAGFKVVTIPSDERGNVDIEALKSVLSSKTAGMMLTNPNTLGLFEENIKEIAKLIHEVDALLYYDGANLNGILGVARPGDMGFDIVHLNLHKTFSTPHGGGGPGAGVVCVKEFLKDYLPVPIVEYVNGKYRLNYDLPRSIGRVSWLYGNIVPIVKAFIYLAMLGPLISEVCEVAVLNTNYLMSKLTKLRGIDLIYGRDRWRKHEFVVSFDKLHKETGVSAEDVAKALLDEGIHAPTIYFPLIVPESHMIELTETEPIEEVDRIYHAYNNIVKNAYEDPKKVKEGPRNTSVGRLDLFRANYPKTVVPTYKFMSRLRSRM